ncbi:outer membrane protein assembly factor BamA [Aliiruegeria sabulilitoris]|uniref:outer membrane protein assembly factor BamA n=1 Tax=Aliiruegeria sabulilitoris TaxID=1510458 RepID=UPI0009EAA85B|nr:outer membrane protein assembly factor BamA [Aliiruegeria sabulilitoris]
MKKHITGGTAMNARKSSRTRKLSGVAALALSGVLMVSGGTFPQAAMAQSYSFTNLDIQGNQRIDAATIATYAGIGRGQTVSAAELNDAYQGIAGTGLFETVELVPSGNTLIIKVQEYPTINVIAFEGNRRLNDTALSEVVESQTRRIYSPTDAEADAANIAEAYRQTGRIAATVTPKIIRRSDNRVDLVFEIQEGKVSEIERISFVGNRSYSDYRLRRALETKQAGIFRAFVARDTLVEDRLEYDKQLLRDFYTNRGYVDVQVLSATAEIDRNRRGNVVTFNLREGQQFRVGKVSVSSTVADIDIDAFRKTAKLRSGTVYSPVPIDTDITRLETLASRRGLDFIRVEPRVTRNDRDLTLDIEYVISRGPRIFVERIDIEGNTTTLDRVVRRQFDVAEGDPFNAREIRQGADRIRALGFFKDAQVEARQGSSSDLVVVDVNVEEAPTGSLGFGASYGTSDGLGFNFSFTERNFLGRGQSLSAGLGITGSTSTFNFNFVEPAFLGRDVAFGLSAYYRKTEQDNSSYDTDLGQFEPSLTFPLTDFSRLGLRATYDYGKLHGVEDGTDDTDDDGDSDDDVSSYILQQEEEMGPLSSFSVGYSYIYDTITNGLDPRSGVYLRFRQDFGGREDGASFVRTEALLRAKKQTFNEDVTFRAELEGGAVAFTGGESRIFERYMLSRKIRGFEPNSVGPRDLNVGNEDVLGGNYFAVARFEAEFPIGLPEEYGISGGLFWDIGSVWGLDNTAGGTDGNDEVDDDFYLRSAAGVALLWDSPLGPLRFNFSRPLLKEDYDEEQNFEFTVSTSF